MARRPTLPLAAPPSLPLPGINKTVTRFGPSRQQFAGAVYIRRHSDHSAHTVLRHNPHRRELPSIPAVTNPKQAKAQKKDFDIGLLTGATSRSHQLTQFEGGRVPVRDGSGQEIPMHGGGGGGGKSEIPESTAGLPTGAVATRSMKEAELLTQLNTFFSRFLDEAYTPLVGQVFKDVRPGLGVSHLEEDDFERYARFVTLCTQYVRLREERSFASKQLKYKKGDGKVDERGDVHGGDRKKEKKDFDDDDHDITSAMSPHADAATQQQQALPVNGNGSLSNEPDKSPFECIGCTMGWDSFHFVQVVFLMAAEAESRKAREKKRRATQFTLYWSLTPLLREMLLTLDLARVAGNQEDMKAADRLQKRLMHDNGKDSGLLPVLVRLIREYNFQHQPRSHAINLIQVLHIVLGALDRLSADPSGFRVRQEARASRGGKKKKANRRNDEKAAPSKNEGLANKKLTPQPETEVALPTEEKKVDGDKDDERDDKDMSDKAVIDNEEDGGIGIGGGGSGGGDDQLHAASLVLPEEEEDQGDAAVAGDQQQQANNQVEEDDDDDDDEEPRPKFREVSFDLLHRIRQTCAHPSMVHFYTWLLQGYKTNGPSTNHAIVSFLERIAAPSPRGIGLEPMLWQLSVLRLFHAIMADPVVRSNGVFGELLHFCVRITRNLFARLVPDTMEIEERIEELKRKKEQLEDEALIAEAGLLDDGNPSQRSVGDEDNGQKDAHDIEDSLSGVERELALAKTELRMKEGCSALGFIELLFWKTSTVSEIMAEEYNWRKAVNAATENGAQTQQNEAHQLGFASYKAPAPRQRKGEFSQDQVTILLDAFERCNGKKDCLDILVFEFGGAFKKVHISRKLKELGLARGKFTKRQEEQLRSLFELHSDKGPKYKFFAITEDLGAGFTENQVKRQLRNIGLIPGGAKGRSSSHGNGISGVADATHVPSWDDVFGSDDDASDKEREENARQDEHDDDDGSDTSSSSSDDDDEEEDGTARAGDIMEENTLFGDTVAAKRGHVPVEEDSGSEKEEDGDGSSDKKKKRSASAATLNGGPTAEQRAKALQMLKMRRTGGGGGDVEKDGAVAKEEVEMVETAAGGDGDSGDTNENDRQENKQLVVDQSVKTFERRRLKKLGDGGDAGPVDMLFDDLLDEV